MEITNGDNVHYTYTDNILTVESVSISLLLETFVTAKEYLSNKDRWTKGKNCRDENGDSVPLNSKKIRQRCLLGAIGIIPAETAGFVSTGQFAVFSMSTYFLSKEIAPYKEYDSHYVGIMRFNDNEFTKHKEIIGILDKCIRKLLFMEQKDQQFYEAKLQELFLE